MYVYVLEKQFLVVPICLAKLSMGYGANHSNVLLPDLLHTVLSLNTLCTTVYFIVYVSVKCINAQIIDNYCQNY